MTLAKARVKLWAAERRRCAAGLLTEDLARRMRRIHTEHEGTYGSLRMTAESHAAGIEVNHKRVERVMREYRIAGG